MEINFLMIQLAKLIPCMSIIKEAELDLLSLFIFNPHLSIFQIGKKVKAQYPSIEYKMIHYRFQKLIKLNLVERELDRSKFEEKELSRTDKYFKISEIGLFVLFYNSLILINPTVYYYKHHAGSKFALDFKTDLQSKFKNGDLLDIQYKFRKEIYKNYFNSYFFKLFLLPWISIDKIQNLDGDGIKEITNYLSNCCYIVKNYLSSLPRNLLYYCDNLDSSSSSKIISVKDEIDFIDIEYLCKDYENMRDSPLVSFINKIFPLDSPITFQELDKNNFVLISKSSNPVQLYFDESKKRLNINSFEDNVYYTITLDADSLKEVKLYKNQLLRILNGIDFDSIYLNGVFYLKSVFNNQNMEILEQDNKFMNISSELKIRDKRNLSN